MDPDPAYSLEIRPTKSDHVEAEIVKLHFSISGEDLIFKYSICVGPSSKPTTNCLDPDVDVWPY